MMAMTTTTATMIQTTAAVLIFFSLTSVSNLSTGLGHVRIADVANRPLTMVTVLAPARFDNAEATTVRAEHRLTLSTRVTTLGP